MLTMTCLISKEWAEWEVWFQKNYYHYQIDVNIVRKNVIKIAFFSGTFGEYSNYGAFAGTKMFKIIITIIDQPLNVYLP